MQTYEPLNAVAKDKLAQVLARVLEKMAANEEQTFTVEETQQLQAMLKLTGEQIDAAVEAAREVFRDAAAFGQVDHNLLLQRGTKEDVAAIMDKTWRKKGRAVKEKIAAFLPLDTPVLELRKTDWRLHLEMGSSTRSGQSQPTAIFQLNVADTSAPEKTERLDLEMSHAELRSLFLQLNAIQAELDTDTSPAPSAANSHSSSLHAPSSRESAQMTTKDSAADGFPLFTAVRVVYRECFDDDQGEFPHVARRIDAFLGDFASGWTLASAYESSGSLRLLKMLAARTSTDEEQEPLYRLWELEHVSALVAGRGDLETMKWLSETYSPEASLLSAAAAAAAGSGHLHLVKWLFETHHGRVLWGGLEWCEALRGGHKQVVDWLRQHVIVRSEAAPRVVVEAARAGELDILRELLGEYKLPVARALKAAQEGRQWRVTQWILTTYDVAGLAVDAEAAAKDGQLAFLQWAYEHAYVELSDRALLNGVALNGHLEVLKWLHDGPPKIELSASVFAQAARGGHLEAIQWLHAQHCPVTAAAMDHAAEGGFLEVMQWLGTNREEGCTSRALDGAARNGHLEIVKWLHGTSKQFYCPFVMDSTAGNGHLDVVKWLHDNRSEGGTEDAMNFAARHGHLEVVRWLHVSRSEGCSTFAMDWAAARGHLDVVKWLHEHRQEGCTATAMNSGAANGHLAIVRWLHRNRQEGCVSAAMEKAVAAGHFDVAVFLRRVQIAAGRATEIPLHLELERWMNAKAQAERQGESIEQQI